MLIKKLFSKKVPLVENVEYELRDKDGNIKPLFQENILGTLVLRAFRYFVPEPIEPEGTVKPGLLNYLAAYGLRMPPFGLWVNKMVKSNLLTNAGAAGVASRINGSGAEAAFTYIAVGTGATAANVADTTLQTESSTSGLSRVNATVSRVTTDVTNDTARVTTTFTVTGSVAVTESGVLNASSAGTLLNRQVFSAVNVANGDSLQVTHNFDVD